MSAKVINPKACIANLAGIPIKGFADGTFITITPMSEQYASAAGADGEVARVATNDKRFRITFSLIQSSDANDLLSALLNTDLNAPNGAGVGILSFADINGRTLFTGPESWIVGWPEQTWGKAPTNRDWVIECAEGQAQVGGN